MQLKLSYTHLGRTSLVDLPPGPWEAPSAAVYAADGRMVCSLGNRDVVKAYRQRGDTNGTLIAATADFIAAAPEVLSELMDATTFIAQAVAMGILNEEECKPMLVRYRAVIAKATGGILDDRYAESIIAGKSENYDLIEIHGVRDLHEPGDPAGTCCEVDDEDPQFFSVYLRLTGGGVECIGDFGTNDLARRYAREVGAQYGWRIVDYTAERSLASCAAC